MKLWNEKTWLWFLRLHFWPTWNNLSLSDLVLALCALYLPDCSSVCLSACLSPSICPSVCLPTSLPISLPACPYAHLSLRLSFHLVCLYVCPFSIFQPSAANLSALYLSVHPFVHLSVSLYSIFPFACMSFCLSVLSAIYKIHLKNGFVSILALLSPYGSLLEKQQNKLKIPKIIVPVS